MPKLLNGRRVAFLGAAVLMALGAVAAYYFLQATTLTIAVAPSGGTEPALIKAYADALRAGRKNIRLKILPFDGVRESAEALQSGRADLAIVRPDVMLPENGLTLAILRNQALMIAAPEAAGIKAVPDLARRRLGILAKRDADQALIKAVIEHYGMSLVLDAPSGALSAKSVALVPVEEQDLAKALLEKRIDAVVMVTTPTTPTARRIVGILQTISRNRKVGLIGVDDGPSVIERLPQLQAVTITVGLFGGNPKLPEDDVSTVGASYRLMARSTLSRGVAAEVTQHLFEMRSSLASTNLAANYILAPSYDTTVAATSARLPIHPGAIDYYEREQEGFIDRYETWIYLVAFLGGGLASAFGWLRQRLSRIRRERIQIATDRLLQIQSEARSSADTTRLEAWAREIDDLAAEVVRHALDKAAHTRTISAAAMAVDAARSTVRRASATEATGREGASKPGLRIVD